MSDTGRREETNEPGTRGPGQGEGSDEGTETNPVTDEAPAGDASEAAERFSRDEGEAPSG